MTQSTRHKTNPTNSKTRGATDPPQEGYFNNDSNIWAKNKIIFWLKFFEKCRIYLCRVFFGPDHRKHDYVFRPNTGIIVENTPRSEIRREGYEHLNFDPFESVEEAHPDRCQAIKRNAGQCRYRAVPGGSTCYLHGGNKTLQSQRNKSLAAYRKSKWQASIERHATDDDVKGLRSEIGILRVLMEERLSMCNDVTDLLLHSGPISDLVVKIEKLVTSCHKLEGQMGQLLDKQAIIQFASQVIGIISDVLENSPEQVNEIADKIAIAIGKTVEEET
jgi:hypothetical protein